MDDPESGLSPDQVRAIGAMVGTDAAELNDLDAEAVINCLASDAEFVAGLLQAKKRRRISETERGSRQ